MGQFWIFMREFLPFALIEIEAWQSIGRIHAATLYIYETPPLRDTQTWPGVEVESSSLKPKLKQLIKLAHF